MIKNILKSIFGKREKRVETSLEFVASVLSCWLITIGTCLLLDSHFTAPIGMTAIVIQTLISIVLVAIVTRRWWIPLVSVGVFIAGIFLAAFFSDYVNGILSSAIDFLKWWFSLTPSDSVWYSDKGFYLIHTIVNIGVAILYFAISRITRRPWVVVLVALGFIVFTYAMGYINYNYWAIPFFIAGIFPYLTSQKFRNKNLKNFKNLFGLFGEKWLFIIIATIIAAAICLSSITAVFLLDWNVRTRYFTDVVADIQTYTKIYTKEQKELDVSLYNMGLASDWTYVGGDLKELGPGVLAVTNLEEPTLVKLAAYDTFDGQNWSTTFDNSYRVNGPWKEEEVSYLATELLDDKFFMKTVGQLGYKKQVTITMKRPSHIFPVVGQAYNFEEVTPNKNQILFDRVGKLFSYYGQDEGFTYSFDSLIYDTKQELLKVQFKYLIPMYGNLSDPNYDPNCEFYKFYTQQYENKPKEIDEILDSFRFAYENYYDKAYEICEYFSRRNGFIYTENPPEFKKGDNIVEKLLETKEGHCVYYATTMIALTRAAGIPSRLAAGYRTVRSSDTNTQVIDRSHPYAWVECYIPHVGWVSFDPTPNKSATPIRFPDFIDKRPPSEMDQDGKPDEEEEDEPQSPGTALEWDEETPPPAPVQKSTSSIIFIIPAIVILLVVYSAFSRRFYRLKAVRRRFKDTKRQAAFYYRDMLRQFRWLGFMIKNGETINELTKRSCGELNEDYAEKVSASLSGLQAMHCGKAMTDEAEKQTVSAACEALEEVLADRNSKAFDVITNGIKVIEAMVYGGLTPTDDDIQVVFDAHSALEKELRNKNNILLYTIKRRLLLPIVNISFKFKGKNR